MINLMADVEDEFNNLLFKSYISKSEWDSLPDFEEGLDIGGRAKWFDWAAIERTETGFIFLEIKD